LENSEERRQNSTIRFRATMHLGMGAMYIVFGIIIMYVKAFGTLELPTTFAYVLSGFMILYGAFRIWRGLADFKMIPKEDKRRKFPDLHGIDEEKK
jgi:hypothetical protein